MIIEIKESGTQYNRLTVLGKDVEASQLKKRSVWKVRCECGEEFSALAENIKRGNTSQCSLCRSGYIVGEKYGRLTVIQRVVIDKKTMWVCRCECGNITKPIRKDSLVSGHTRSCGCLQKEHVATLNAKDLSGQKIGRWTVLHKTERRDTSGNCYYLCECECGNKGIEVSGKNLISKRTLSCGCLKSKGEEKISELLQNLKIDFVREYRLPVTMSTGGNPRLDFAIFQNNQFICGIEYQGEQHYFDRITNMFTKEKLEKIRIRDEEKAKYCETNSLPIIYIPYTDYDILTEDYLVNKMSQYYQI